MTNYKNCGRPKWKREQRLRCFGGVHAYNEWRTVKLSSPDIYDVRIVRSDLEDLHSLNPGDFEFSICKFLAEVVKVKDRSEYPDRTLCQFCVAIPQMPSQISFKHNDEGVRCAVY